MTVVRLGDFVAVRSEATPGPLNFRIERSAIVEEDAEVRSVFRFGQSILGNRNPELRCVSLKSIWKQLAALGS